MRRFDILIMGVVFVMAIATYNFYSACHESYMALQNDYAELKEEYEDLKESQKDYIEEINSLQEIVESETN